MADLLIEQLCQTLAEKLQAAPSAGLNDLITYLKDAIKSDVTLKTALTQKAVQINQGDARGYQVLVEGGRAYIGEHLHVSDPNLVEAALNTILKAYASKPVGTPSNLPLSGVVKFVGRDEALEAVHEKLQQTTTVAITSVSGMGGVGKTELALQYAYGKLRENAYSGGICWVQARSQNVGIGILEFARNQLGLPQPPEDIKTVSQQVKWVCGRWRGEPILIVLDDVTDYANVKPYLEQLDPRFQVLMTTRLKLDTSAQRLELEVLTEEAALELLRVLVDDAERIDSQLENAKRLCEWLGRLPLGLELVGRYLARKPDLRLAQMLERLEAKKLKARALLQTEDKIQTMTARLGVAAAFQLTWEEEDLPNEARWLCGLLSVFALAPIPWQLVQQCLPDWDEEDLEDCRDKQLIGRSLLSRVGQERYQLHQLMREFFVVKLETELSDGAKTLQQNFAKVLTAIAKTIPDEATLDVISRVEDALPHIEAVAEKLTYLLDDEDKVWSMTGLAWIAWAQNRWQEAEQWLKQSLQVSETELGKGNLTTAVSLNNLAEIYHAQGHYDKAEQFHRRAMELRLKFLDKLRQNLELELTPSDGLHSQIHITALHIAASLNNLAALYVLQGRYNEAEYFYEKALQMLRQSVGEIHPHIATGLSNLADLYRIQKRYSEAELRYQQSLQMRRQLFNEMHPDIATSLNHLALLYGDQERYSEAELLHQQALQLRQKIFGENHRVIADSFKNLAALYAYWKRYSEAEFLFLQALRMCQQILGRKHPDTIHTRVSLAGLYLTTTRYSEAEPLYLETLETWTKFPPKDHFYVQRVWNDFYTLIQQVVESDRTQELSSHPITQALVQKIQAQNW
ncbi:MAG: tetratricopeptide repeat protein [Symploca sp. SIO2E6]|nr:tetratricopeptide repeat protein [Symploca sp. SIO2E6]